MRIECLGDSITEGWVTDISGFGWKGHTTYPDTLSEELSRAGIDAVVKNYGNSGSLITEDSYLRLSGTADMVILLYGLNNYFVDRDPEGLLEINIDEILAQGSKLYLLNYPQYLGSEYEYWVDAANSYIAEAAEEKQIELLDAREHFENLDAYDELFGSDRVHLSAEGYRELGKFTADCIIKRTA